MRILNASFAVLSDPAQRRVHDAWIARTEAQHAAENSKDGLEQNASPAVAREPSAPYFVTLVLFLRRYGWVLVGVVVLIMIGQIPTPAPAPSGLPRYDPKPLADEPLPPVSPAKSAYLRPNRAPNGSSWPKVAGYVKGYPRLQTKGLSKVTIDNSENAADVFVKAIYIGPSTTRPVRQFFIPAYGKFTIDHLTPGTYDIRYMDLNDGTLARTPSFLLEQVDELGGTRYSSLTMTLYKVANGNMRTSALLPSEF